MSGIGQTPLLTVRGVETYYGKIVALRGVDIDVNDGEIVTLIGANGAGKSTLMMTIFGDPRARAGRILFEGRDITKQPTHEIARMRIAQAPEGRRIFSRMTVFENLQLGATVGDGRHFEADVERVLSLFPRLKDRLHQRGGTLSGGEQQMLAIGRGLASAPKLLLLDEPLAALDRKLRKEMQIELKRLQHETGITFVFVTHDQEEALTMSDRIAVMSAGELQQLGDAREIYERPRNMFVADFIGETNLLPVTVERVEGAQALCRMEGGHAIACDAVEGAAADARLHISIRPERLSLVPEAQGGLTGIVRENIFVGTDITTLVDLPGGPNLTVRTANSAKGAQSLFDPGARVAVQMEEGAGRLLVD